MIDGNFNYSDLEVPMRTVKPELGDKVDIECNGEYLSGVWTSTNEDGSFNVGTDEGFNLTVNTIWKSACLDNMKGWN